VAKTRTQPVRRAVTDFVTEWCSSSELLVALPVPPRIGNSTVSNIPWRSLGLNPLFLFSGNQARAIHYSIQPEAERITFMHSCLPSKTLDARIDGIHQCVNRLFLKRDGCPASPFKSSASHSPTLLVSALTILHLSISHLFFSSHHPPKLTVTCRLSSIYP
jgi:hypothetical protein